MTCFGFFGFILSWLGKFSSLLQGLQSWRQSASLLFLWGSDSFSTVTCSYAACCSPVISLAKWQEGIFEVLEPFSRFYPAVLVCYLGRRALPCICAEFTPLFLFLHLKWNQVNKWQNIKSKWFAIRNLLLKGTLVIKTAQNETIQMHLLTHTFQGLRL